VSAAAPPTGSGLPRLPILGRLAVALAWLLVIALTPSVAGAALLVATGMLAIGLSGRQSPLELWLAIRGPLVLVILVAIAYALLRPGAVDEASLLAGVELGLRLLAAVVALMLVFLPSEPVELADELVGRLRLPAFVGNAVLLIDGSLAAARADAAGAQRARRTRGMGRGGPLGRVTALAAGWHRTASAVPRRMAELRARLRDAGDHSGARETYRRLSFGIAGWLTVVGGLVIAGIAAMLHHA